MTTWPSTDSVKVGPRFSAGAAFAATFLVREEVAGLPPVARGRHDRGVQRTFRAQGDLGRLVGKTAAGTWRLRVTDLSPADSGTLEEWGSDVSPAMKVRVPEVVW